MSSVLGLLWLFLLLAVAAWLVAALVSTRLSRRVLAINLAPQERARRSFVLASLPGLASVVMAGGVAALALGKSRGWVEDHCEGHGPGHPHLCFEHLPAIDLGAAEALAVTALLVALLVMIGRFLWREGLATAQMNTVLRLVQGRGPCSRVDDDGVFAIATGVLSPRVLLSRGLLENVGPRERRIVLAHEVAHLRRGDLAKNWLFEVLLLLHFPPTARRLRAEWRQALEEWADDTVAQRFGREAVAATLVKVARCQQARRLPGLAASGADTLRRIERLLHPAEEGRTMPVVGLCLAGVFAVSMLLMGSHHFLETLLGLVTGH